MLIGIVSDTHDNMANFKKALEWLKEEGAGLVLHCGDIQSQETIGEAGKIFSQVKFVRGNADFDLPEIPDWQEIEAGGKKIAFVHFPAEAKNLAQSGKYDLVFYGHTHRPCLARQSLGDGGAGECLLINPGELAGQFNKPTFALYDTDTGKLELKILEKL